MAENLKSYVSKWRVGSRILYLLKDPDGSGYMVHQVYRGDSGAIDELASRILPREEVNVEGCYSRQQTIEIARLAGYNQEQIEAALLLADAYDVSNEYDLCRTNDKQYERLIKNAKRRLTYWSKKAQERHGDSSRTN